MNNLIFAELGAIAGIGLGYLCIKTAENNSKLVQPIAQLFGIVCLLLLSTGILIGY